MGCDTCSLPQENVAVPLPPLLRGSKFFSWAGRPPVQQLSNDRVVPGYAVPCKLLKV